MLNVHFGQIQYFFKVLKTSFEIQYFFNNFRAPWEHCFFRWNISVVCLTVVLKLAIKVFFSLYFETFWPKWLCFFRPFQKRFGLWPKKNRCGPDMGHVENHSFKESDTWNSCQPLTIDWHASKWKIKHLLFEVFGSGKSELRTINQTLGKHNLNWSTSRTHFEIEKYFIQQVATGSLGHMIHF